MKKKIPVIVVSGFLGSGKTTFLRYLLKESNKKFGLIINEFGDVGIDGDLIKSCDKCDESEDDCVIELNNGCLCCTVQDDFVPSIKALLEFNPPIESIIIETSGLALPIPLIQALNWPEIRNQQDLDLDPDMHGQDLSGNEFVKFDLNYIFDFNFKKETYKEFLTEEHDHNHVELVSDSIKLNYFLEKNDFEKEMSKILDELNILRIKGRIWIPNKSLPLQIQIVGKKINTWFEEAPDNCWRPNDNAGLELVIISFDEKSIKTFTGKIKEKFKILSEPKIAI